MGYIWKSNPVTPKKVTEEFYFAGCAIGVVTEIERSLPSFTRKDAVPGKKDASTAAAPPTKAAALFQGQRHPKKHKKISVLDQWVEVTVEDGKTVTRLFPSNEGLIERGQKMLPPPIYVYRRMNFIKQVPPEYHWMTDDPMRRANGGMCLQRMTVETWLEVIEREKLRSDGHVGPTGVGNMPRPKERGGCACPVCTKNAKFFPGV